MNEQHYLVPLHDEGYEKDITYTVTAKTIEDAEDWFVDAKQRLLDINNWEKYAPMLSVEFRLADGHGKGLKRCARKHDHIRIDVPGSVSTVAGGFDWATIEAMEYDDYPDESMETFAVRIRPSEHPQFKSDSAEVPEQELSSTFVISRQGKSLFAAYHGRNELIHSYTTTDSLQSNDNAPGWLGLTDVQWTDLVKSFLK